MQSVGKKRRTEIARLIAEIRSQIDGEPTAKAGIDPLPDLIDAFIRAADEQESLMIPVAIGITRCTNTRRAMDLDRIKQHYLSEIRRLRRRA
jgi:hypothetical protein